MQDSEGAGPLVAPQTVRSTGTGARGGPVLPRSGTLTPVDPAHVRLTGGLWADRQRVNAETIIEHCRDWIERIGWIRNFDLAAAGTIAGARSGVSFVDSEVYKLIEAMAWELGRAPTPALESAYRDLVSRVGAAQEADGYLHTAFGRDAQQDRYSDLRWGHELYCFGHLIQAAVARLRTGHDDELPAIARRLADHVWREFGPQGRPGFCGHPELEPALVEFGRAVDEPRYVELARLLIERRGHRTIEPTLQQDSDYWLDDLPIREAQILRGHAVRALYLAAGATDLAVETEDGGLLNAVRRQYDRTLASRTYLTGGMGARHDNEAFGEDFELPADRSYCESCAAIGSIMTSWRLLLATGESGYADTIERTLLNAFLVSSREDGRAFFYANTLHQRRPASPAQADRPSDLAEAGLRVPWFEVSCCPTNIARTYASVSAYFATTNDDGVQLHQYADLQLRTELEDGTPVELSVSTGYPFEGHVAVTVLKAATFTLTMRVPAWSSAAAGAVGGERVPITDGRLVVRREFAAGDTVELDLAMTPSVVRPDPRIDAVRGSVAIERGPLVLCLESVDLPPGVSVEEVVAHTDALLVPTSDGAEMTMSRRRAPVPAPAWPYGDTPECSAPDEVFAVPLRPYFRWGNRGPSSMRVWLPLQE